MTQIINLTEDEFDANYSFLPNHLNPDASWVIGDGSGCLFETYGEELEFVRCQNPRTIWTLLDGNEGDLLVVSGYHFVNRIGYLISTVPLPENMTVECSIPMLSEEA